MTTNVLVIAAHPDDELLGVAGTLRKHVLAGDRVTAVVLSEGASARYESGADTILQRDGKRAAALLGLADLRFLGLPDQRLDTLPLLEVTQKVEAVVDEVRPQIVYTHHWGDANRDHRVVVEAVTIACRPIGDHYPRAMYCFETPSSTEWSLPSIEAAFVPNHFVDVTDTLEDKLAAMACYATELRPAPHPRSLEALRARAAYWGQIITRSYAEAFVLVRSVG